LFGYWVIEIYLEFGIWKLEFILWVKKIGYIDNLNDNDYVMILLSPLIILTGGR